MYPGEPNNSSSARKGGGRTRRALIGGHGAGRRPRDAQGSADGRPRDTWDGAGVLWKGLTRRVTRGGDKPYVSSAVRYDDVHVSSSVTAGKTHADTMDELSVFSWRSRALREGMERQGRAFWHPPDFSPTSGDMATWTLLHGVIKGTKGHRSRNLNHSGHTWSLGVRLPCDP